MFFKGARAVRDPKKTGRSAERVGHAYFLERFGLRQKQTG
jgi:hypothetical protein